AHVVGRGALHADRRARQAAEDIAAADHQAQLDPEVVHRLDLVGDAPDHGGVETVIPVAHQRFARYLEEDAAIRQIGWHASWPIRLIARRGGRPADYTKVGPPQRRF